MQSGIQKELKAKGVPSLRIGSIVLNLKEFIPLSGPSGLPFLYGYSYRKNRWK
jgi:hypothetical protein